MKKLTLTMLPVLLLACNPLKQDPLPDSPPAPEVSAAAAVIPGVEEDCDDKVKKPIEIKEDSISLSGDAGCTLDE